MKRRHALEPQGPVQRQAEYCLALMEREQRMMFGDCGCGTGSYGKDGVDLMFSFSLVVSVDVSGRQM